MTQSSCLDDLGEYALGDLVSPLWLLVFVVVVAVLGAAVVVAVSVAVVVAVMGLLCFILFGDTKGDVDDDDPTPLNTFNEARRTDEVVEEVGDVGGVGDVDEVGEVGEVDEVGDVEDVGDVGEVDEILQVEDIKEIDGEDVEVNKEVEDIFWEPVVGSREPAGADGADSADGAGGAGDADSTDESNRGLLCTTMAGVDSSRCIEPRRAISLAFRNEVDRGARPLLLFALHPTPVNFERVFLSRRFSNSVHACGH